MYLATVSRMEIAMRACLVLVVGLIVFGFVGVARADGDQEGSSESMRGKLGLDGAFVVPLGKWRDEARVGYGALVAARAHAGRGFALTGRAGYVAHSWKDYRLRRSTSEIPVLFGVKWYLGEYEGFYVGGEIGVTVLSHRMKTPDDLPGYASKVLSRTSWGISGVFGVGVEFANVDVRGQVYFPTMVAGEEGADSFVGVMLNLGYRFFAY